MPLSEFAPAKVNLTLHVTGQRADGYHLLDSLVVFADVGDVVSADPADRLALGIWGEEGRGLSAGEDNLILRAARALGGSRGASLTLEKNLPVASGIGGGSADAAAALRLLSSLWGLPVPGLEEQLALGADVPVCLSSRSVRMRGVGERVARVPALPELGLVLVNPRVAVPTPDVFRALAEKANAPMPDDLPDLSDPGDLIRFLSACRNDLEAPAMAVCPEIGDVLEALRARPEVRLARMSGSGATCFGIVAGKTESVAAAAAIAAERPGWWVRGAAILPG
jgi:4-diphosphocytidyl-2-C-methyl-D-erythritol kinase